MLLAWCRRLIVRSLLSSECILTFEGEILGGATKHRFKLLLLINDFALFIKLDALSPIDRVQFVVVVILASLRPPIRHLLVWHVVLIFNLERA